MCMRIGLCSGALVRPGFKKYEWHHQYSDLFLGLVESTMLAAAASPRRCRRWLLPPLAPSPHRWLLRRKYCGRGTETASKRPKISNNGAAVGSPQTHWKAFGRLIPKAAGTAALHTASQWGAAVTAAWAAASSVAGDGERGETIGCGGWATIPLPPGGKCCCFFDLKIQRFYLTQIEGWLVARHGCSCNSTFAKNTTVLY